MTALPSISAITVTYGRPALLNEALACFLAQDYQGPKEMLILNTCPEQTLVGDFPNVRIINLKERPPSLGTARNMAIAESKGDYLTVWDDDDLYLPWHLRNYAEEFCKGDDWIMPTQKFSATNRKPWSITSAAYGCFAFSRRAWEKTPYHHHLSTGEDRTIINGISAQFPGRRVEWPPDKISFIYCWAHGSYHISAHERNPYQQVKNKVGRDLKSHRIPTGRIVLQPKLRYDYVAMTRKIAFGNELARRISPTDICVVALGRYGDIANVLPIALHIAEQWTKPIFMVAREFADILDGVSYVRPWIVDQPYDDVLTALHRGYRRLGNILVAQAWGRNWHPKKRCATFDQEAWGLCNLLTRRHHKSFRLLFDKRSNEREMKLLTDCTIGSEPFLLYNLSRARTAPFAASEKMINAMKDRVQSSIKLVDAAAIQATRIYDLVGLIERASLVVSIDTSLVHLAAATNVPTIALQNPMPWVGSSPRSNVVAQFTYTQAAETPQAVCDAIALQIARGIRVPEPINQIVGEPPKRTIYHAVERHDDWPMRRKHPLPPTAAELSWKPLYDSGQLVPAHLVKYPRDSRIMGDRRTLPFLKDVLGNARQRATSPSDIILLTNGDIILHPEIPEALRMICSLYDACMAKRMDYGAEGPPAGQSPAVWAARGKRQHGRDLLACTVKWLDEHWYEIPDFLLGATAWDTCICSMVRQHHGHKVAADWYAKSLFPSELPLGYIAHLKHKTVWDKGRYRIRGAANKHNRKLFAEWSKEHCPQLLFNKQNVLCGYKATTP